MSFNPPSGVTNGAEYTYGNIVWRFDATVGVWNIVDGSIIGGQGPKGDQGNPGAQGNTGSTGAGAATGDNGAFIVTNGVGTVRIGLTGATGVASFDPRFFSLGASGHIKIGGTLEGIVISDQGKNEDAYGWGEVIDISGVGGMRFDKVSKGVYQIVPTAQVLGVTGVTTASISYGQTGVNGIFLSGTTGNISIQNTGVRALTVQGSAITTPTWYQKGPQLRSNSGISIIAGYDDIFTLVGPYLQISNTGLISFNGVFGEENPFPSMTGDGGAVYGYENNGIGARLGSYTLTGVASFDPRYFGIGLSGHLVLTNSYQATGDTIQAGSAINIGTGKIINNIGVTAFNGATGAMTVTGSQHGVPYINTSFRAQGGLTASSTFVFNGTSLTFGSTTSTFTVTGPNIVFGAATEITGGVFKNPTESAPHFTITTTNDIVVNGISGSIQRYTITPSGKVTIKAGAGWHALSTATETIALIIQNRSSFTGSFDSSILVDGSGSPILFGPDTTTNYGVTGGVSVVTLMRVNKGGGAGLTMGFVISTGMTAAEVTIN
jgi:hypothetical protein